TGTLHGEWVPAAFARQLERELDALRCGDSSPSESPLAWAVFLEKDPHGYDYRVFADEHAAQHCAADEGRDSQCAAVEIEPLYRASAFARSASEPPEVQMEAAKKVEALTFDANDSWECSRGRVLADAIRALKGGACDHPNYQVCEHCCSAVKRSAK